jgi:hypothetical protein
MYKNNLNLRKVVAIAICLTVITVLSGCDNEKEKDTPAISVANNSSLTQEVYADNSQGKSGVSFTTTGAWTSNISTASSEKSGQAKATKSSLDWVSVSPDSGKEAGNYTVAITLKTNTTGADRTAIITISCNGTNITITVTQKGVKEDGTVPEVGIGLEVNELSLTVGDSQILKEINGQKVTFTSSNPNIVTVRPHPDGYSYACELYAAHEGSATVTATNTKGKTATCTVTVTKNNDGGDGDVSVKLEASELSLTTGSTQILKEINGQEVTFTSSNPNIVTVRPHPDGYPHACELYATSVGSATITVTNSTLTD